MKLNKLLDRIIFQKQTLDPKLWDSDQILVKDVREKLLDISKGVWENLKRDGVELADVVILGSSCSFFWSPTSDLDLHIVFKAGKDCPYDLIEDFYVMRSVAWNDKHDIKIAGHPLELFVKKDHPGYSDAIFSIKDNSWIRKPNKKDKPNIDEDLILKKATFLAKRLKKIISDLKESPSETLLKDAEKFRERLKDLRQSGLESGGEFSSENLTFKIIRKLGLIEDLKNQIVDSYDLLKSLK